MKKLSLLLFSFVVLTACSVLGKKTPIDVSAIVGSDQTIGGDQTPGGEDR